MRFDKVNQLVMLRHARLTVKTLTDKKKLKNKKIIYYFLRHCFRLKLLHNNRQTGGNKIVVANQSQT
jgi:hypothetical protein